MLQKRIIPCLLLRDKGLVKTIQFKDARYIGDPINAVRIFNEKEWTAGLSRHHRLEEPPRPNIRLINRYQTSATCPSPTAGRQVHRTIRHLFNAGVRKC
jgi:hypothetical protein